jgi:hypothetical protein
MRTKTIASGIPIETKVYIYKFRILPNGSNKDYFVVMEAHAGYGSW